MLVHVTVIVSAAVNVARILFVDILTRHSAKRQAFALIRKFNFEKSYALISMLWCLKYIYIWLTPFGPLYGGPGDPQVPKMAKPGTLYWYHIRWKSLGILCLLMSKSQNFTAILCNWENRTFCEFWFYKFKNLIFGFLAKFWVEFWCSTCSDI